MSQVSIGSDVKANSGIVVNLRTFTPASEGDSTSITSTTGNGAHDYVISVVTSTYGSTVNLPTTSNNGMEAERMYYICDQSGSASTNNITIDPGSGNISGQSTWVISTDYSCVSVVYVTTNVWHVI